MTAMLCPGSGMDSVQAAAIPGGRCQGSTAPEIGVAWCRWAGGQRAAACIQ